ncbi:MAG: 16S rRNA (guanine(527)-N(7))-methyltransferase RsmG [Acidobacteriota bacterium]
MAMGKRGPAGRRGGMDPTVVSGYELRGGKVSVPPRQDARPVARTVPAHLPAVWSQAQWQAAITPVLPSLDLTLSEGQVQQLAAYMVLLAHWNGTFNLTALREPQDMLTHHLADCLAVLAPLDRHLAQRGLSAARLLDVGSGGGLPGVVLAIARPEVQVTCVDTVGKKAAFIRQVAAELKLSNLRAEHARVEQLKGAYDVITSRAFASLADFVSWSQNLLAPGAAWMAMKGKAPVDEQAQLPEWAEVFHVEPLGVPQLDAERCVVWIRRREK